MIILGLNAYHGDSSACLVRDGELVAAVEEERFRRVKHWAGFPGEAIRSCLEQAGVDIADVDHIAVNRRPGAHFVRKALFAFARRPGLALVKDRISNAARVREIREALAYFFQVPESGIKARVHHVEHHLAHLGSSFFVSPYESAAVVSVDGFGDFVSTMWGEGRGGKIEAWDRIFFPHSLGLFYLAITQFLGFPRYGDEYKVMGLAPYGEPAMMEKMRRMVILEPEGRFTLDLDCFLHHSEGVTMTWQDGEPSIGTVYSDKMVDLLGPPRRSDEPLTDRHRAIAASVQAMYEQAFIHILGHVHRRTQNPVLCLAGGCAMNSVANGKIFERTGFRDLYVQSAAGDGGGAVGAAYSFWNQEMGQPRKFVMDHAFLGPEFSNEEIWSVLDAAAEDLDSAGCRLEEIRDEEELCRKTACRIADGDVIGWFQGRMEWGPRALGNRSILCDPRRTDMKEILNLKIKRRESFRPFAPSILRGSVGEWFETEYDVPFMLQVYQIREEKREKIPAVTHVNGSGRLQTVTEAQNRRYWRLIREFEKVSGVPIVLNTSFNENEPVVCRPQEALDCFLRTQMDVLVMGSWYVERGEDRAVRS